MRSQWTSGFADHLVMWATLGARRNNLAGSNSGGSGPKPSRPLRHQPTHCSEAKGVEKGVLIKGYTPAAPLPRPPHPL